MNTSGPRRPHWDLVFRFTHIPFQLPSQERNSSLKTHHTLPVSALNAPDSQVSCIYSRSHFIFEESQAQRVTSPRSHSQPGEKDSRTVSLQKWSYFPSPIALLQSLLPTCLGGTEVTRFLCTTLGNVQEAEEKGVGNKRVGLRLSQLPWCCVQAVMVL